MKESVSLRAALCTALLSTLTACGGGGNGTQNDPKEAAGTPSQVNQLTVERSDGAVVAGTYALDTAYTDASSTVVFDADVLEHIAPESPAFDSGFIYAQKNPKKFAVFFTDNTHAVQETFACRSAEWSAAEVTVLNEGGPTDALPLCPSNITIDTAARKISFSGLTLPSLSNAGKSMTVGANFGWTLQHSEPILVGSKVIKVESGSTLTAPGSYRITGGEMIEVVQADRRFSSTQVETTSPKITFYSLDGDASRYMVVAEFIKGTTARTFLCFSAAWTEEEVFGIVSSTYGQEHDPGRCSDKVIVQNGRLILDKAQLYLLDASADKGLFTVLSLNVPVSTSTSTGSGSTSTAPAPAPTPAF